MRGLSNEERKAWEKRKRLYEKINKSFAAHPLDTISQEEFEAATKTYPLPKGMVVILDPDPKLDEGLAEFFNPGYRSPVTAYKD